MLRRPSAPSAALYIAATMGSSPTKRDALSAFIVRILTPFYHSSLTEAKFGLARWHF
jgi:hypothetical protein